MPAESVPHPLERLGRDVEIFEPLELRRGQIRYAVLDFDGTISLLRAGWQQVMSDQFVRILREQAPTAESPLQLTAVCRHFITALTGRQTIYQTIQLEEEIRKRGGEPLPAALYKRQYLELLSDHIRHRVEALRTGQQPPADYLLRGTMSLLKGLTEGGVTCFLASGTDVEFVREEAELLGVTHFFNDSGHERIYGALEEYRKFSKQMIIDRILRENSAAGSALAVFGDGYVEIANGRQAKGTAIGVASLESGELGWDMWKKARLAEVGAQILVPDWQEADLLLDYLGIGP